MLCTLTRRAREHVAAVSSIEPTAGSDRVLIDEIELSPALELLRTLRHNLQLALSDSADARESALPAREMSRRARPLVTALRPVLE